MQSRKVISKEYLTRNLQHDEQPQAILRFSTKHLTPLRSCVLLSLVVSSLVTWLLWADGTFFQLSQSVTELLPRPQVNVSILIAALDTNSFLLTSFVQSRDMAFLRLNAEPTDSNKCSRIESSSEVGLLVRRISQFSQDQKIIRKRFRTFNQSFQVRLLDLKKALYLNLAIPLSDKSCSYTHIIALRASFYHSTLSQQQKHLSSPILS